jgi:hypothetical protein
MHVPKCNTNSISFSLKELIKAWEKDRAVSYVTNKNLTPTSLFQISSSVTNCCFKESLFRSTPMENSNGYTNSK